MQLSCRSFRNGVPSCQSAAFQGHEGGVRGFSGSMRFLTFHHPHRFLLLPLTVPASFTPSSSLAMAAVEVSSYLHVARFTHTPIFVRKFATFSSSSSSAAVQAAIAAATPKRSKASKCQAFASIASPEKRSVSRSKPKPPPASSTQSICPGCGVPMQSHNPNAPGFFKTPKSVSDEVRQDQEDVVLALEEDENSEHDEEGDEEEDEEEEEDREEEYVNDGIEEVGEEEEEEEREVEKDIGQVAVSSKHSSPGNWTLFELAPTEGGELEVVKEESMKEEQLEELHNNEEELRRSLDVLAPTGLEFGANDDGGWNQVGGNNLWLDKSREKGKVKLDQQGKLVVCTRCHQLRHYGRVENKIAENLLPDFDFELTVGKRLAKTHAARSVVVMVIDSVDFDGSFPRRAAVMLSDLLKMEGSAWRDHRSGNAPRVVLVANKIDLLPKQISPTRLDHWIRRRAREGGAPHLSAMFLVSCLKNWGIKAVLEEVKRLAGPRGEVWVIGAQNAGKSSLINALSKVEAGARVTQLTEAPVPGTTLGILRLNGILPSKAKLFDTPGILHPHQITVRLSLDEQKMVQVRKELKPLTYRTMAGTTLHVGGLVRLDVKEISTSSIYITFWGSPALTCHLGKTAKASEMFEKYVGVKLQPPSTKERLNALGPWVQTSVKIVGDFWDRSTKDIAIAGLGWFAVGLKGTATFDIWTYEGVAVTTRDALVPDMARIFGSRGFTS